MAAHASSAGAMAPPRGPAVSLLAPNDPSAAPPGDADRRALRVAKCSLCGLEGPISLMMPDGGDACDDLRWYCKDARSCTQRWTSRAHEPEPAGERERDEPESAEAKELADQPPVP